MKFLRAKSLVPVAFAIFLLAGTTGCETVKTAREAQKGENLARGERSANFAEYEFPKDEKIDLAKLEAVALDANPAIFQARQAVVAAQLAVKDIKSDYLPTLDAEASYSRATSNSSKHGQTWRGNYNSKIALSLDLLLFDFGKTDAALDKAVAELVAAEKPLVAEENRVRYEVRQAYFELCRAIEMNVVAVKSVEQYRQHFAQMRAKYEVGSGTKYDCTYAEVDFHKAVLEQIQTQNNILTARANLNLALGFEENAKYEIGGHGNGEILNISVVPEELMKIASENEPGFLALLAEEKAASAYVDKTIADLYPDLGINVTGTLEGSDLDLPKIWNVIGTGTITQSVFNAGKNERAIENAVSKLRSARSAVAAYRQNLFAKISVALLNLTAAKQQYEVARLASRAAQENFEIVSQKFSVGKASSLDRTDAQVSLTDAHAQVVAAEYDYFEAVSEIRYLLGNDDFGNEIFDAENAENDFDGNDVEAEILEKDAASEARGNNKAGAPKA